jgi:hypothetical protein
VKSALGNAAYPAAPDIRAFLAVWSDAMGITFTVLTLLALVFAIVLIAQRRDARIVAASVGAQVAILTPLFLRTTRAFPRYLLPMLPCVVILLAGGLRIFDSVHPLVRRWRAPALALVLLAGLTVCGETCAWELPLRGPDELAAAVNAIRSLPQATTLFLPEEALLTFEVPLSQRVCQQMVERARDNLQNDAGVIQFVQMHGIPSSSAKVFLWSLNESEQTQYRRLAAACTVESPGSRAIFLYYAPYDARNDPRDVNARRASLATMDLDAAIQAMHRTEDAAILVPFAVMSLGRPLWSGKRWHWYRH